MKSEDYGLKAIVLEGKGYNGVFITRAKGMPFEEFKKVCIQRFREAGMLTEEKEEKNHEK